MREKSPGETRTRTGLDEKELQRRVEERRRGKLVVVVTQWRASMTTSVMVAVRCLARQLAIQRHQRGRRKPSRPRRKKLYCPARQRRGPLRQRLPQREKVGAVVVAMMGTRCQSCQRANHRNKAQARPYRFLRRSHLLTTTMMAVQSRAQLRLRQRQLKTEKKEEPQPARRPRASDQQVAVGKA